MLVKSIENITISGFCDYKLYSFKYTPGFAQNSGSVSVEFFKKDGDYSDVMDAPIFHDYFPIHFIKEGGQKVLLGNFTVTAKKEVNNGSVKLLMVDFVDASVELDRHLIALRGAMGYDSAHVNTLPIDERGRISGAVNNSGRIIWVGETDKACDEQYLVNGTDPCDPCSETVTNPEQRRVLCEQYYLENRRQYEYSFPQLLAVIRGRVGNVYRQLSC